MREHADPLPVSRGQPTSAPRTEEYLSFSSAPIWLNVDLGHNTSKTENPLVLNYIHQGRHPTPWPRDR